LVLRSGMKRHLAQLRASTAADAKKALASRCANGNIPSPTGEQKHDEKDD
jgi:hypothetical protein